MKYAFLPLASILMLGASNPFFTPRAYAQAAALWPTAPLTIAPEALESEGIHVAIGHKGALPPHVDVPAYIDQDDRKSARLHPVGQGRVQSVLVTPGEVVKKGQVLFTYDDFSLSDERQRLLSAEAALQQARALRDDASLSYDRARSLQGGAVSQGEAQRRYSRLRDAQGTVKRSEALVQNERERLARFTSSAERADGLHSSVISPIDGIVNKIIVSVGEEVSNRAAAAVEIDDLSHVWVVSQVGEQQATRLSRGGRQLTWPTPDSRPIESRIDLIEGSVDPMTRHVLVRSLVDNSQRLLRPEMLVKSRLFSTSTVSGVLIPQAAIQTIGNQSCVFVRLGESHYEARKVSVGPELDGTIVVTSGLKPGETVVTDGSFVLKSQALLSPPLEKDKAGGQR
ncbi:efflux RND transporter periplasmic adaptor subunit [Asaia sp. W19]|uniref:efflux RND transporter periplasmic adaptor subunit n=1 Tax=unclassified Asaia TaxID=2685023 RepID=UPI000F8E6173|nr:efflux RND transporter periplasmic adaptor subunit [Asaia sp. W19]RUT25824.1 efflux RND transporter periplasmic adaptor subunit [Asaia sp. W19]